MCCSQLGALPLKVLALRRRDSVGGGEGRCCPQLLGAAGDLGVALVWPVVGGAES